MNRRLFLRQGSAAALAIAGLPLAIKKANQNEPTFYRTDQDDAMAIFADQFKITIYHNAVRTFNKASDAEKILVLKASDTKADSEDAEFRYEITKSELTDKENDTWRLTVKAKKSPETSYEFPNDFPKKFKLSIVPGKYIEILTEKGKVYHTLLEYKQSTDSGCFLTTACVHHQQLPDNCEELQTLRLLRDGYMNGQEEGRQLIREYAVTGPAVVAAIDSHANKQEIYDYIYEHLICRSVTLIKQGQSQEAVELYTAFVNGIMERYN